MIQIVEKIENMTFTFGRRGTQFWLRDYLAYQVSVLGEWTGHPCSQNITGSYPSDTDEFWLYSVIDWWQSNLNIWGDDIKIHPTEHRIQAFRLRTGLLQSYSYVGRAQNTCVQQTQVDTATRVGRSATRSIRRLSAV
jgi:hypothetical protein